MPSTKRTHPQQTLEKIMHKWIQVSVKEVKQLQEKHKFILKSGHFYTDIQTGTEMVEYHVDTCDHFHTMMKYSNFGGNISVTFPADEKPIVLLGHDECIFKQFQFTNKGWVSDEWVREILPKDKGLGS